MALNDKERFLTGEIFGLTIAGAFGHGKVYRTTLPTAARKSQFRRAISERLDRLMEQYAGGVSEKEHVHNIDALAKGLSRGFPDVLERGRLRIGTAQKLVNLYLKYCWVLGWIREPPHCPFDRTIIANIKATTKANWTEIEFVERYLELVQAAHAAAEGAGLSLAAWELEMFSRKADLRKRIRGLRQ
jgi:hypothetical protein